jgi:hypothetical protein
VLWRDRQPPLDLGDGAAVDVNDNGVVAIRGLGASFLWENGTLTRLRGSRLRPHSVVEAINDDEVAVGSIVGSSDISLPVVWRDGALQRLSRPRGRYVSLTDVNNAGLAVGNVTRSVGGSWRTLPWWWDTTTGQSGPLSLELAGWTPWSGGIATSVDDDGRIVGDLGAGPAVKWWHRHAAPQTLFPFPNDASSLYATGGMLTGNTGGFRGFYAAAHIARLSDDYPTPLPDPPPLEPDRFYADNTYGLDIARGVTPYAPHGGITVVGWADYEDVDLPIMWTCTQTYLSPTARFCGGRRITVDLAAGDRPTAGADVIWGTLFRDVINSRGGRDTICAREGADIIRAGTGRDVVLGGGGNDGIMGGGGVDRCDGGPGNDAARCETRISTNGCSPSYPTVCVPPLPPDLDCFHIAYRNFRVLAPDPHKFDTRDPDRIGCEI